MDWEVESESADGAAAAPAADNPWAIDSESPAEKAAAAEPGILDHTIDTMKHAAHTAGEKLFGGGNEYGILPSVSDTLGDWPSPTEVAGKISGESQGLAGGLARGAASVPGMVDATQAETLESEADRLDHSPWLSKEERARAQSYRDHAQSLRASSVAANRDDSSVRNQLKTTGDKLMQSGLDTLERTQPKDPGVLSKLTLDVAGMAPAAAAIIGSGALAGPAGVITAMGATQYGGSWQELSKHPELSDEDKQKFAAASTALATVLNVAPTMQAFKPAATAVQRFLGTLGVQLPIQEANSVGQQLLAQQSDVRDHLTGDQWAQLAIDTAVQTGVFAGAESAAGSIRGRGAKVDEAMANHEALKKEMFGGQEAQPAATEMPAIGAEMPVPKTPPIDESAAPAPAPKPTEPPAGGSAAPAEVTPASAEHSQLDAVRQGTAEAADVLPLIGQGFVKVNAEGVPVLLPPGIRRLAQLQADVSGAAVPSEGEKSPVEATAKAPAAETIAPSDATKGPEHATETPKNATEPVVGARKAPKDAPRAPRQELIPAGPTFESTPEVDKFDLAAVKAGEATAGQIGRLIEMGLAKRTSGLSARLLPSGLRRLRELETGVIEPEIQKKFEPIGNEEVSVKPTEKGHTIYIDGKALVTVPTREDAERALKELREARTHSTEIAGQPITVNPNPTQGQRDAGNYLKGKITLHGLQISIENPKGSIRRGTTESGKPWESTLAHHYGYIRGTVDNTEEHVDVFIGDHPKSEKVYVIDQLNEARTAHDEPKVVMGALNEREARATYQANYQPGWNGIGAITKMSVPEFKAWVKSDATKRPVAWKPPAQKEAAAPVRSTRRAQAQHDSALEYLSKTTLHGAGSRGLNFDDLVSEGLDPKELQNAKGHGINRPFTKAGGSLDHAAEILAEAGYPVTDEAGRPDKNKLLDLITSEIRNGQRTLGAGAHHDSQIERLRAKYDIPADLEKSPDHELEGYLDALQAHVDTANAEHRRNMLETETESVAERKPKYDVNQADMFSDVAVKNEIKRLETEKDRRRNSGQESVETGKPGDLFSKARDQVDIEDKLAGQQVREDDSNPARAELNNLADDIAEKHGLQALELYPRSNGDINLMQIEVPKGSRGQGAGTKAMLEIIAYADKRGARLVLTPDTRGNDKGTTSRGRLVDFYKRFGFVENKGRNKDFQISDGMYRPAKGNSVREEPEAYNAEPFYSQVVETVSAAPMKKATAENWSGWLKNQPGVKAEEIAWLGLDDWLSEQTGPVTKEQIAGFVRANQIEVKEVLHGRSTAYSAADLAKRKAVFDEYKDRLQALDDELDIIYKPGGRSTTAILRERDALMEERDEKADEAFELPEEIPTKFFRYTLPGGTGYHELLLTLPADNQMLADQDEILRTRQDGGRAYKGLPPEIYKSPHWDTPNVLAHIRFDERTDADGKRVLHVAEIQSDWHQAGRKRGYAPSAKRVAELDARRKELERQGGELRARGEEIPKAVTKEWIEVMNELQSEEVRASRVPDAPFKTTWPELSMKRVIRYAAENGFDRVTWDTGATNAERYDLSKQISRITLHDNMSGGIGKPKMEGEFERGHLIAYNLEHRPVIDTYINSPAGLVETIGKEAAEKLMAVEPKEGASAGIGARVRELAGVDLKVGGEGMIGFYDKMLPATVNKLVKRWGGKVSESKVQRQADPELTLENAERHYGRDSDAYRQVQRNMYTEAHSLDITPAMRDAAMSGFAVFDAKKAYGSQLMLPFGPAIAKKVAHVETRPNTTPAQVAQGAAALRRLLYLRDRGAGASLLASDLPRDFIDRGHTSLIGASPKTAMDFAELAQVYRDPSFETFRVFLTKGDEIVHHSGVTSRLPGVVMWGKPFTDSVREMQKALDADGFWLMHNHPSGDPTPSPADVRSTMQFAMSMKGFRGHVIVDHNKFGVIRIYDVHASGAMRASEEVLPLDLKDPGYRIGRNMELSSGAIGKSIGGVSTLAGVGKTLGLQPGDVAIIATRSTGEVGTILSVPRDFFRDRSMRVFAKLRRIQRVAGASRMFAVTDDFASIGDYLKNGLIFDAVSRDGQRSWSGEGIRGRKRDEHASFGGRDAPHSHKVNAPIAPYAAGGKVRDIVAAIPSSEFVMSFRRLINPTNVSDLSMRTARIASSKLGQLAFATTEAQSKLEQYSREIDKLSPKVRLDMIDDIENGRPQRIRELQPIADVQRQVLDGWRKKIQDMGLGHLENFIEDYFPHYWQDPVAVKKVLGNFGRRPLKGSASFLKQRTIPTIKEGIDLGFKPMSTNPLILTFMKLREMQRFYTGVKLMEQLKAEGLAKFVPAHAKTPEGWVEIKDAVGRVLQWSDEEGGFIIRGRYMMPEDAGRIINNHVSASALRDFAPAQAIRIFSNALNALQLGFSGFHLGFTTLDAMISKNAMAIERLAHGEPGKAALAFLEGFTPVGAMMNVHRGYMLRKAYTNIGGATPLLQQMVAALAAGGGRIRMDSYFSPATGGSPFHGAGLASLAVDIRNAFRAPASRIPYEVAKATGTNLKDMGVAAWRSLQDMGHTLPMWQIPLEVAGRLTRASTSVIMEHIVPMQKLGVFYDLAADAIRRKPDMTAEELAASMQRIWTSVDNRLGEMVYDNLFWNRTLKDSLHMAIRAVGWNYGTFSEIGGAPIDAMKILGKAVAGEKIAADDIGHKIPYVFAMVITTMMLGAALQYLFTGKGPEDIKDYFFPRTGAKTKAGTPERLSLPSYAKDVFEYSQHPTQTIANKLNPIYGLIHDVWSNSDYFGGAVYNPDSPFLAKAGQVGKFVLKQSTPFSIQGGRQIAGSEQPGAGGGLRKVMPMIGLTPAPGYITSHEQMERRQHYEDVGRYMKSLRYQIKQAQERGDTQELQSLREEMAAIKKSRRAETKAVHIDKKLRDTEHKKEQHRATGDLSSRIEPIIEGKTRTDAIDALRGAGMPAMADLLASLPKTPRRPMQAFYRAEARSGGEV